MDDLQNGLLRQESGSINNHRQIVAFLYILMRDHITPGTIESLVTQSNNPLGKELLFTNGWLAQYAENIANRITEHK